MGEQIQILVHLWLNSKYITYRTHKYLVWIYGNYDESMIVIHVP